LASLIDIKSFIEIIYILFELSNTIQNNRLYIFNYRDNSYIKLGATH